MIPTYPEPYAKIVRASCIFDSLVMLPFAIPGLAGLYVNVLKSVQGAFALGGTIPEFAPLHLMFMNLFGFIVLSWSVVRFFRPDTFIVKTDIVARFVFSGLMLFYYASYGVTSIVLLLTASESFWGLLQIYGLKKAKLL